MEDFLKKFQDKWNLKAKQQVEKADEIINNIAENGCKLKSHGKDLKQILDEFHYDQEDKKQKEKLTIQAKRYKRLKERLNYWPIDDVIEKAALIGAQYGYEWADQFEVAEGIIECNSLGIAEKVADELEDSIPTPNHKEKP